MEFQTDDISHKCELNPPKADKGAMMNMRIKRRVIALLTREEMEFLEKMGMDSLFSTGTKLSRIDIISALIDTAIALGIDAKDIHNKKELIEKILKSLKPSKDSRRYPRIKKDLHVEFRKMDSMEAYKHSTTNNIGIGGFSMDVAYLDKPPQVHQVMEIEMKDLDERGEPIKAIGRIAWLKEKEGEHGLEIGVMLTYIDKKDEEKFIGYLTEEKTDTKKRIEKC